MAASKIEESSKLLRFMETEHTPISPLLPEGAAVKEGFEKGEGDAVGTVQLLKGTTLVLHKNGNSAFRLQRDSPVFAGDILITEKESRVSLLMQDSSLLVLAAQSKLVLDRAIYDSGEGRRDTKLQLLMGRMRAVVSKLAGRSIFSIQTPTAVAGVRGTDFALAVAPSPDAPSHLMTAVLTGGGRSFVKVVNSSSGTSAVLCPLSIVDADVGGKIGKPIRVCWKASKLLRRIAPEIGLNCGSRRRLHFQ
ncbi:FecR domain-containing protein [Desulfobulbus sp. F4]|nr:FecR domain-containing protein [Desulfobulbus sp. F4]